MISDCFARFSGSAGSFRRILVLSLLSGLAPACGTKIIPPIVTDSAPALSATNIAHWPLIVLQWGEAMDPATMNGTNIKIYDNATGLPFGPAPSVMYLAGSFQSVVITNQSLLSPTGPPPSGQYIVSTTGAVKALDGRAAEAFVAEAFFTVKNDANASNSGPLFSGPVAAPGAATTIDITFNLATDNAVTMSGFYDVYQSTTLGGENLLLAPTAIVSSAAAAAGQPAGMGKITMTSLTPATTYYFIVVARDTDGNVLPTAEISAIAP